MPAPKAQSSTRLKEPGKQMRIRPQAQQRQDRSEPYLRYFASKVLLSWRSVTPSVAFLVPKCCRDPLQLSWEAYEQADSSAIQTAGYFGSQIWLARVGALERVTVRCFDRRVQPQTRAKSEAAPDRGKKRSAPGIPSRRDVPVLLSALRCESRAITIGN